MLSGWAAQEALDLVNPAFWSNHRRIEHFRDRHRGERCFILGNGPSLIRLDLSKLRGERTFGLNRIYLLFPDLGFATTYYAAINDLVIEQCAGEMRAIESQKFIAWRQRRRFRGVSKTAFVRLLRGPWFGHEPGHGVWGGGTVTYVALQLAFFMGFEQVILIGVDHRFQTKGPPHSLYTSYDDDQDHFHANYFGKGFRWQLPDLAMSELAYRYAKAHYEQAGRQILDATRNGALDIFDKVRYEELF